MAFYISSAQIVETKVKEDRWRKADQGWAIYPWQRFFKAGKVTLALGKKG